MQAKDRSTAPSSAPWNKGKIVGQKRPFKLQEVWAIRIRLQLASRTRDLALFDLAIDSKLRGCDLVAEIRAGNNVKLLWLIYSVRCNLFHGSKALSTVQNQLLSNSSFIVRRVVEVLLLHIETAANAAT